MRVPNGQPIYLSTTIRDRTGALVDAGALVLTVVNPDATLTTFNAPTHDSIGTYHQDITAAQLPQNGHYQYTWTATGTGAGVSRGEFEVFDPLEPTILPLDDAKQACNIPTTVTTYDAELQVYIDAITADFETLTGGPAFNRAISERVPLTGNLTTIAVRQRPLVSVTSITSISDGTALTLTDLDIDPNAGIVRRKLGWPFLLWRGAAVQVVYVAGWGTAIPAAFNAAARTYIEYIWASQRGPGQSPVPGIEGVYLPGMAYMIPALALTMMRPYTQEVYV